MSRRSRFVFANRLERLPPYLFARLNALKYEKRRQGIDVIDLGMGNPADPTFRPIVRKLCEAASDPRNQRYSATIGLYNLRREVARMYERDWDVSLDPETEIISVIGTKEGYAHLCLALLGPGDTAIVPAPAYPIHIYGVALAGANVLSIPLEDASGLMSRVAGVVEGLYPKPKVLVINFPHNQTTAVVEDESFYRDVVKFCKRHNLIVIHDFAYGKTTFDGYRAPSFLRARGAKEIGVEFITMSKAYNMAGWRIGFCVGNREIIGALAKIKSYYDYGIFQAIQIATIVAMRECEEYSLVQAKIYQKRRDVLCRGLRRIGWEVTPPKATMFAWVPIPEPFQKMGSIEFSLMLLEEANVAVSPGRAFGEEGEGYLRFALVENEQRLNQAIRQIDRALRKKNGRS